MVADSDGLLVQPTSEHRNFESKTFQKEVSSSNDSFSGVNYVSLPECSPWDFEARGDCFFSDFFHSRNRRC